MSILIKGMVKPKDCLKCPMCNGDDDCILQDKICLDWEEQMKGCPITVVTDTNVGDTISRQAAIDALDKRFDSIPVEQTTEILMLRRDLRELPPVPEKTGHWIPVSERLPETADTYLVSRREIGWNGTEYSTVDICFFTGGAWTRFSISKIEDVIAWQPMPEAYRKDGDN